MRPDDKRLNKVKKQVCIRHAKTQVPEAIHHNRRIGNIKKVADILNNRKEVIALQKALGKKERRYAD